MPYEVELLEPAAEFLERIGGKLRAKAVRAIDLLRQFGPALPMPHAKRLTDYPLTELRAKQGSDIVRLFYFSAGGRIYVVTSGYVKKENKTDRREIERAMRLRATILERRDEDH